MPVGTWHQAANAVDYNSVGELSAGGIAVNTVGTVLDGMDFDTFMLASGAQTVSDISAVEIITVSSGADVDTISENTT